MEQKKKKQSDGLTSVNDWQILVRSAVVVRKDKGTPIAEFRIMSVVARNDLLCAFILQ